ncbi:type III pantothenate kinase [Anaerofustis sp.]|uniref:type III pantothenate kinase n=1 Tax=Anaerofustis sp. TaxID=1872517 RepID=UPI0025B83656|nr:type III pantothenate kinase [Anaerofustis sp.]
MILVIDVGNTTTQLGIFKGEELIHDFRYITKQDRTSDEIGTLMIAFFSHFGINIKDFQGAIISSVVPDVNYHLVNAIKKYLCVDPMIVGSGIKTGINVRTDNPKEVGADRIVDAAAAYNIYKCPVIVVNFGTATRYDYVNNEGIFSYAVTSPGIQISADALWKQAAKLPKIEIEKPKSILASNTTTSMQAGLVYGYIGQVEYVINKMKEELNQEGIKVVACGGYGKIIYPETDVIDTFDPLLTLKGLKIIYDKNKKK